MYNSRSTSLLFLLLCSACANNDSTLVDDTLVDDAGGPDGGSDGGRDASLAPDGSPEGLPHFTITPSNIRLGETATLSWEVGPDAAYCRINQGFGIIQHEGTEEISPTRTMNYTLSCPGGPAPVEVQRTLTVENAELASTCGNQGSDVFLFETGHASFREGQVPTTIDVPIRAHGDAMACRVRCSENWLSAELFENGIPVELPAIANSDMTLRLTTLPTNLNMEYSGWCDLVTEGGDPRYNISVSP